MQTLPPSITPLNQHSLDALEFWLHSLGAQQSDVDPCLWSWILPMYSAQIEVAEDELRITWEEGAKQTHFGFPYGLSREDVEAALKHGP